MGGGEPAGEVYIVGIGASAGGLEALNELVRAIPEQSGFAYVIVQHLSPHHQSMMDRLLATQARIPVVSIAEGQKVEPDKIYVLPAGPWVTIRDRTLHLHARDGGDAPRTPIDRFLVSLAESEGRTAFCVILSGTGSDGTFGVRAVKEAGGFAIVQQSDSARFPGMPDSAVATGLVDFALTPRQIPERLIDIARHRDALQSGPEGEDLRTEIEAALPNILAMIDDAEGHDFSAYKTGTLVRRIERRMTVLREPRVSGFVDRLITDPEERVRLAQDFLIGVTRFFRDEAAFDALWHKGILPLLERDQPGFRIWVPGCATGEEAYSLAILMAEAMERRGDARPWQVFGTDIDVAALRHARTGIYTEGHMEDVSQERREAFFVRTETAHQVIPQLRERCIFAPHNVLSDPPFSRLDLISCRNLLIYLTAEMQASVFHRFHYGLNPGGYLFLGPSETLGKKDRLFFTIDREARLFRREDGEATEFSSLGTSPRDAQRRERWIAPRALTAMAPPASRLGSDQSFESQLLAFFARQAGPPFAAVNANDEISYLSEPMGRFVRPPQGQPSAAIDQFLVRELRLPVRTALSEVRETRQAVTTPNVMVTIEGEMQVFDLTVQPLPFSEGEALITLQPVRIQDAEELTGTAGARDDAERELIERELAMTRRQLSATLSSYEMTEQELKSSNEELLSMNEELQSSNEELETSREELQSINEELETVNSELTENNLQLLAANSDLRNLFDSTDIATVFLDQFLCVRRFTPALRQLFGIQERDIGRPITDLKWRVSYQSLEEDSRQVAATLQPIEREVSIPGTGETFLLRIRPYRRTDDRIDGCVLTFVDITARKRAERQLAENAALLGRQYSELETLYDTTPVGLCLLDRDLRYLRINERLAELNGKSVAEHVGRTVAEVLPDLSDTLERLCRTVLDTGEPQLGVEVEGETAAAPGETRIWIADYYPVLGEGSEVLEVGVCVTEVTEQKRMQRQIEATAAELAESRERLALFVEYAPAAIAMFDEKLRYVAASRRYLTDFGLPEDFAIEGADHGAVAIDFPENWREIFQRVLAGETIGKEEEAFVPADGSFAWVSWRMTPWRKADDSIGGALLFSEVKTAEVEARRALQESEARLNFALETSQLGAWELDVETGHAARTLLHDRIFGHEEMLPEWTFETFLTYVFEEDRDTVRRTFEEAVARAETWSFQCRIVTATGDLRWIEAHGRPHKDGAGKVIKLLGTVQDITLRKEAEQQQSLLLNELQHRVKNTMATTMAIVHFSAGRASDVESFTRTLQERLEAVARTHDLLTANDWRGARLREIVTRELAPYVESASDRLEFDGPDPLLSAKQMLSLTLAFHELITNAVKHGALSVPEGRVVVAVETGTDGMIDIAWTERGGPVVTPPAEGETGFGTLLLDRISGPDLKGRARTEFNPDGLVWRVRFPDDRLSAERKPDHELPA